MKTDRFQSRIANFFKRDPWKMTACSWCTEWPPDERASRNGWLMMEVVGGTTHGTTHGACRAHAGHAWNSVRQKETTPFLRLFFYMNVTVQHTCSGIQPMNIQLAHLKQTCAKLKELYFLNIYSILFEANCTKVLTTLFIIIGYL